MGHGYDAAPASENSVYPCGRWREYFPPTQCAWRASEMPLVRAVECVHTNTLSYSGDRESYPTILALMEDHSHVWTIYLPTQ
jgi:hypothetical protein